MATHLKYLQKTVTRPAAKAFRARNGRQVKTDMLFRASWLANMQAFGNAAGLIGLKT